MRRSATSNFDRGHALRALAIEDLCYIAKSETPTWRLQCFASPPFEKGVRESESSLSARK
jgi:hypothetical protein